MKVKQIWPGQGGKNMEKWGKNTIFLPPFKSRNSSFQSKVKKKTKQKIYYFSSHAHTQQAICKGKPNNILRGQRGKKIDTEWRNFFYLI